MKKIVLLLSLLAVAIIPLVVAKSLPGPDQVIVGRLDEPLPVDDKQSNRFERQPEKFLWDKFANKPEESKFKHYTNQNWRDNYAAFSDALVKKAAEQKLEHKELKKILDAMLAKDNGKIAFLPVGAYRTTQGDLEVWIVVCKWGTDGFADLGEIALHHINMRVFDIKTLNQVAFQTCL